MCGPLDLATPSGLSTPGGHVPHTQAGLAMPSDTLGPSSVPLRGPAGPCASQGCWSWDFWCPALGPGHSSLCYQPGHLNVTTCWTDSSPRVSCSVASPRSPHKQVPGGFSPLPSRHALSVSEPGWNSSGSAHETHAPQFTRATNMSCTVQGSGNSSQ